MKVFKDTEGRTWAVTITVDAIKRVRSLCDVNLLEIIDGALIERLLRDPVLLCDVVYAVCQPEAEAKGISDEDFGRAMAGDAIEHATTALLEELVDFSPRPENRANLQRVLKKTWAVLEKADNVLREQIESFDPVAAVEQALKNVSTSSGSAPESSESTPGP